MPESFIGGIGYILQEYGMSYLLGAAKTLEIALVGTFIGCLIGFLVGIVRTIPVKKTDHPARKILLTAIRAVTAAYVEIFRGTPMMVQAMFLFFGASAVLHINMTTVFAAFFIVSINTGAYMAESVRGGIYSTDPGQTEGAKALGMTHFQTMVFVVLPQALRNIMPQIGNNLIINIKDTCVLSVIGVVELFYTSKGVAGAYYRYFEAFTITMVIYFIMTFACSRILRLIERRMDENGSYKMEPQAVRKGAVL